MLSVFFKKKISVFHVPPEGAPKKLRGEKTARFRDAVLFECDW
jgi:hypothetical protein